MARIQPILPIRQTVPTPRPMSLGGPFMPRVAPLSPVIPKPQRNNYEELMGINGPRKPILTPQDYRSLVGAHGASWTGAPNGGWTPEELAAQKTWGPTTTTQPPQAPPPPVAAPPQGAGVGTGTGLPGAGAGTETGLPGDGLIDFGPRTMVDAWEPGTSNTSQVQLEQARIYYSLGSGQVYDMTTGMQLRPQDIRVSNQNPVTGKVDVQVLIGGQWVKADTDVQQGEFTTRAQGTSGGPYGMPTVPEARYAGNFQPGTLPVPQPTAPQLPTVRAAQEFALPEMTPQTVSAGQLLPGVNRSVQLPFTQQDYGAQGERLTGLLSQAQGQVFAYEDAISNLDAQIAVQQDPKRADSMRAGREMLQRQLELANRQQDRLAGEQKRVTGLSGDLKKQQDAAAKDQQAQRDAQEKAVEDARKERDQQAKDAERQRVSEAKASAADNSVYRSIDLGASLTQAQAELKALFDPGEIAAANERIQGMKNQQDLIKAGKARVALPSGVQLPPNAEEVAALDQLRIDPLDGTVRGLMDDGNWGIAPVTKRVYDAPNDRWIVQLEGQWFIAGEGTDFSPRAPQGFSTADSQAFGDAMGRALLSGDRKAFEQLNAGR